MNYRLDKTFKDLLLTQFKDFYLYYIFAIIALVVTHKIQSDLPFMARDLLYLTQNAGGGKLDYHSFIYFAVGIIIFRTASRILFFYPARVQQKKLREELLYKIESSPPFRYQKKNSGELFTLLNGDIDQVRALVGFVGLQGGNFIIGLLILIPRLLQFNSKLMIALLPIFFTFAIFTIVISMNRDYFKKMQEANAEIQNHIIESYHGKKSIKNFRTENVFIKIFEKASLQELYYFYKSSLSISITLPLISLGIGTSLIIGAKIIFENGLGAENLVLFSGFVFLFIEPLSYLSWIGIVLARATSSWKRLHSFNTDLITKTEIEKKLEEENQEGESFTLPFWEKRMNIDIKRGSWNILVSKTAHGKSSILLMIAHILKCQKKNVSMVFQDPYIYNDSIIKNIFLGKEASIEEISQAKALLTLFGLESIEPDLDKLLQTEVGENGKKISGGQGKRLALIRSLMTDSEYIIWDDPFSSVDLISEKDIIVSLKKMKSLKAKTFILSSHRLTTVKHSDYFIYIDKDEMILESGIVDSYINNLNSKVYDFFKKQMV